MQNSRLWIFTQRGNKLFKAEVEANGQTKPEYKEANNTQMQRDRSKLKKLYVDKTGLHCFMLTGREIYYNYFYSENVMQLPLDTSRSSPISIKSIDILIFDERDTSFFEMLLGSEDGAIYHGVFTVSPEGLISNDEPLT